MSCQCLFKAVKLRVVRKHTYQHSTVEAVDKDRLAVLYEGFNIAGQRPAMLAQQIVFISDWWKSKHFMRT